jgi:hypothetical protein
MKKEEGNRSERKRKRKRERERERKRRMWGKEMKEKHS